MANIKKISFILIFPLLISCSNNMINKSTAPNKEILFQKIGISKEIASIIVEKKTRRGLSNFDKYLNECYVEFKFVTTANLEYARASLIDVGKKITVREWQQNNIPMDSEQTFIWKSCHSGGEEIGKGRKYCFELIYKSSERETPLKYFEYLTFH